MYQFIESVSQLIQFDPPYDEKNEEQDALLKPLTKTHEINFLGITVFNP